MGQIDIQVDFEGDFELFMRNELSSFGMPVNPDATREDVFVTYYDSMNRRVGAWKRKFFSAQGLVVPSELQEALEAFKTKVELGQDLTPHLSLGINRHHQPDGMLIDWGIYHFHLGIEPHPTAPGFVQRTDPILYAKVTDNAVYGITMTSHGAWADKELLEVLHAEFPDTLSRYRVEGILGVEHVATSNDHAQLRKAGVVSLVTLRDGTVYMPPGMGFTTNGRTSVNATMWMIRARKMIQKYQERVLQNASKVASAITTETIKHSATLAPTYTLKLEIDNGTAFAAEYSLKLCWKLGPVP